MFGNVLAKRKFITLVGLQQETIVVQGLPLHEAHIILRQILPMLFSDFKACGLKNILIPPMIALVEYFHAVVEKNVYLFRDRLINLHKHSTKWILGFLIFHFLILKNFLKIRKSNFTFIQNIQKHVYTYLLQINKLKQSFYSYFHYYHHHDYY